MTNDHPAAAVGKPVGWGLVGGSGFAAGGAIPAVLAAGNARLCSILSRDPGRATRSARRASGFALARRLGGRRLESRLRYGRVGRRLALARWLGHLGGPPPRAFDRLDAVLRDPDVEAVWVLSPPDLHPEHAIAALEAGRHVLCEKPMATTSADARRMADAAARSGRLLAVGYHMRQHPTARALRRAVEVGEFGAIESLAARLRFRHPDPSDWHRSKARSGGWAVCEAGTHLIDLALWFLGDAVESVQADLSSEHWGFETDDHAVLSIRFEGGCVARLEVEAGQMPPSLSFELVGTDRRASCPDILLGPAGSITVSAPDDPGETTPVPAVDLHRLQVEQFGLAIRGDPDAVFVPAIEAIRNLEVIERARGW
ncbi:Gfo/Idh/MocA family protein [Tautonia plasticadhaerens]|uniref:1,5-anhydro-D-fructose reductase n=1 Tax=Tautonia plasticadhaerens TaxID=2527974 RepID=A0A518GZW1_9BACT|nr:Gfo/Idh/MocA family oxidoreductase [Tautonia plasticadhaerens]QDV34114.1 1,5-anhydro-D-fructose reductase [Tautonia plasticadhaerens]